MNWQAFQGWSHKVGQCTLHNKPFRIMQDGGQARVGVQA
jgi:hypothetical protein